MPKNATDLNRNHMVSFRVDTDSELFITKLQLYYLRKFGVKLSVADILRTCLVNHYDSLFPNENLLEKVKE